MSLKSLYGVYSPKGITLFLCDVDDILITSNNEEGIYPLKAVLSQTFKMKDLSLITYFGIRSRQSSRGLLNHQRKYINSLVQMANLSENKTGYRI